MEAFTPPYVQESGVYLYEIKNKTHKRPIPRCSFADIRFRLVEGTGRVIRRTFVG